MYIKGGNMAYLNVKEIDFLNVFYEIWIRRTVYFYT